MIVFSSGPGLVRAAVGDTVLGTTTLRPGNNALRFRLPRAALDSLRSTSAVRASTSLLTLTSLSSNGTVGAKVARKLVLATPPKPRTAAARH